MSDANIISGGPGEQQHRRRRRHRLGPAVKEKLTPVSRRAFMPGGWGDAGRSFSAVVTDPVSGAEARDGEFPLAAGSGMISDSREYGGAPITRRQSR